MKELVVPFGTIWLELAGEKIDFEVIDVTKQFNQSVGPHERISGEVVLVPRILLGRQEGVLQLKGDFELESTTGPNDEPSVGGWFSHGYYLEMGACSHDECMENFVQGSHGFPAYQLGSSKPQVILFQLSYKKQAEVDLQNADFSLTNALEMMSKVLGRRTSIANCILGGALGDALGYPIEFDNLAAIDEKYGNTGITFGNFVGQPLASDDTQMTLFTASGLLLAGDDKLSNVWQAYQDWLDTQFKANLSELSHEPVSWLVDQPEMFASREPGRTCLFTIMRNQAGTLKEPINDSKGCGGVMRVAPFGLLTNDSSLAEVARLGAETSALTHGHQMSSLASAFVAVLVRLEMRFVTSLKQNITEALAVVRKTFADYEELAAFTELVEQAESLAENSRTDSENLRELGEGWVAEETVVIALYCALRYQTQPLKAIEVAVNHQGDSDSTGSLAGQIVGLCQTDTNWWPKKFVEKLDLSEVIFTMVDRILTK